LARYADGILPGTPAGAGGELEVIRQQIEQFDTIDAIDPKMCAVVERNWPHLVAKLPPEDLDE
jgi:hypothetical protein